MSDETLNTPRSTSMRTTRSQTLAARSGNGNEEENSEEQRSRKQGVGFIISGDEQ